MTSLESAERRLEAALVRIEAALARPRAPLGDGEAGHEIGALREECARLNSELERAWREQASYKEMAEKVAERLNGTISELDALLES
jgi:hypothetical protein